MPDLPATDQHPSHSVLAGEQLMKTVYEALRASPQWNETLLIITYDEHGGALHQPLVPPTRCCSAAAAALSSLLSLLLVSCGVCAFRPLTCGRFPSAGFHDHVPTPLEGVPNPDGRSASNFNFNRSGVRVPTLMVSPWIKKGTLVHQPPEAHKPHPTSQFEHTSMLATLKKVWCGCGRVWLLHSVAVHLCGVWAAASASFFSASDVLSAVRHLRVPDAA